ncbi:glycerophosphoryl diester phosphodiesterase [Actinoplanes sp. NBRC 14428]|uniref:Glycerophosphoryl diester phosphodiesterase n=1 Tax=Pseudosporangium ferrugineum TaxID=439699 RepID=A0A2T0S1H6_9ACTN|nr:glycerophosphodiester phosphodiesterase family protein [Pseudosporangium ferrugineum]PRY27276.1 glycerophosphoryl diester phosphodiesterase [Pseudosporangium ferrugineum]BCJ53336.1 glycerophosphoryl diester phosphodiesterase [Actinoplanes sp. NBRC 14428]
MSRPLVFAHRGGADALPEHTLAAYLRALHEGADGVECDVRLTRDGHLVCVHDRRLDRTSNGRGRVSTKTLAELDALDFGSWHPSSAELEEPLGEHTRLLTLDALLEALRDTGRPVQLLIETKHPSRYGAEVERRLVETLRRHKLADPVPDSPVRVTVMSFAALALRRIRALAPAIPTVYLLEILPPGVSRGRLPFGARIAGPGVGLVRSRPQLIESLRAAGIRTFVWTVNQEADLDLVLAQGADGIITDRPRFVIDRLENAPGV